MRPEINEVPSENAPASDGSPARRTEEVKELKIEQIATPDEQRESVHSGRESGERRPPKAVYTVSETLKREAG